MLRLDCHCVLYTALWCSAVSIVSLELLIGLNVLRNRLQEVNQSWDKSPTISGNVGALSADCRDLLDKIFVVDPKQRIKVAEIMKHPWFSQPMTEPFASSLDKMHRQNKALAEHMSQRTLDQVRWCMMGVHAPVKAAGISTHA